MVDPDQPHLDFANKNKLIDALDVWTKANKISTSI